VRLDRRVGRSQAFAELVECAADGDPARELVRAVAHAYVEHSHRERVASVSDLRGEERRRQAHELGAVAGSLEATVGCLRALDEVEPAADLDDLAEALRVRVALLDDAIDLAPRGRPRSPLGALRDAADAALPESAPLADLVRRLILDLLDVEVDATLLRQTPGRR
jgi:hypothetical protein